MLLNEPAARSQFDEQELKDIAARVKAKFQEFNVLGSVYVGNVPHESST